VLEYQILVKYRDFAIWESEKPVVRLADAFVALALAFISFIGIARTAAVAEKHIRRKYRAKCGRSAEGLDLGQPLLDKGDDKHE